MDENKISDIKNPTMIASRTFNDIIELVQTSNLNFQLQVSPFSAYISLKKSLVKDKSGAPILPPTSLSSVSSRTPYQDLELQNNLLKTENDWFKQENKVQDSKNKSFKDILKILEKKIGKIEAEGPCSRRIRDVKV